MQVSLDCFKAVCSSDLFGKTGVNFSTESPPPKKKERNIEKILFSIVLLVNNKVIKWCIEIAPFPCNMLKGALQRISLSPTDRKPI